MVKINAKTIMAPAAAFTMACLLFTYTRSSIRAARTNAQNQRDAHKHQSRQWKSTEGDKTKTRGSSTR
ncbi:hypothetical protein VTJ83DRAFT_3997 [Remersonia thermophila]|uniref:Secreted protein n=1 Tax=Remersonia thermophila TaxID=72144 RepID=A0ABR4DH33_9PEZI